MDLFAYSSVAVADVNIRYIDEGNGPCVLLCHGFPETSYSWRHQIKALVDSGYRVIAPDLRGYGGSSSPEDIERFTIVEIVKDLIGLVDVLGLKPVTVVGHDWGAVVAWHAALLHPEKFNGVAAFEVPFLPLTPVAPTKLLPQTATESFYMLYFQAPGVAEKDLEQDVAVSLVKIYAWLAAGGMPALQKFQLMMVQRESGLIDNLPAPQALPWLSAEDLNLCVESFKKSGFRGGLNYYRNIDRNWELMKAIDNFRIIIPAMFMISDSSMQAPGMKENLEKMRGVVSDLRSIKVVEDCGHWIQQERPEQTTIVLLEFLGSLADSSLCAG